MWMRCHLLSRGGALLSQPLKVGALSLIADCLFAALITKINRPIHFGDIIERKYSKLIMNISISSYPVLSYLGIYFLNSFRLIFVIVSDLEILLLLISKNSKSLNSCDVTRGQ
jgi:hypothetical protein